MSLQPSSPEGIARSQPSKDSIVLKVGRGQSVEVTQEGGYKIRLPWWDRLSLRLSRAIDQRERKNANGAFFSPNEMNRIVRNAQTIAQGSEVRERAFTRDRILRPAIAYIQAIDNAPSIAGEISLWEARYQMRNAHPHETTLPGLAPLSSEQEAYLVSLTQAKTVKPRDIPLLRHVIGRANFRTTDYLFRHPGEVLKPIRPAGIEKD